MREADDEPEFPLAAVSEGSRRILSRGTPTASAAICIRAVCAPCPTCSGRGFIKTAQTACYEIFREIMREERQFDAAQFLVLASQEVVDTLLDEESDSLAQLEDFIGKPIKLQPEPLYAQEQFDVVPM